MRRFTIGVGAVVVAAVFAAVIAVMAFGTNPTIPPPSGTWGILPTDYPTGGQSNDCSLFVSTATNQFRIDNPQSLTYTTTALDGTAVSFTLKIATTGPKKDKYFDWSSTANVVDIGVKGGSDTARYGYTTSATSPSPPSGPPYLNNGLRPVFYDTAVHATLDNQAKLYNLSNVTFCYNTAPPALSGKVFADTNNNGQLEQGEGPVSGSGRTVTLYLNDGLNNSTSVTTTSDPATGDYTFTGAQIAAGLGSPYRICVSSDPAYSQSLPGASTPSLASCTSSGQRPLGYKGAVLGFPVGNLNFGEAPPVVTLAGSIFTDWNGDGAKNGSGSTTDTVQAGITRKVRLYGTTTPQEVMTTSGTFSFANVPAERPYRVCLVNDANYAQSSPTLAVRNCNADPGADQRDYGYSVTTSSDRSDLDFGETPFKSVSGNLYNDANQNGVFDGSDAGLSGSAGWRARLYANGVFLKDAQPASDGSYSISVLSNTLGPFKVCELPPSSAPFAQTQPLPSTPRICSTLVGSVAELAKGYNDLGAFPSVNAENKDFGTVAGPRVPPTR